MSHPRVILLLLADAKARAHSLQVPKQRQAKERKAVSVSCVQALTILY